ncbi:hypothetical protein COY27_02930 [Candidatus Woesearchaeota archaeon CG_4_10_14_0_2_um_filter_33_13]|nr:MAG: hypothetical protein COY27_02930 [Candidatus Woesearchaeota archaeon CG_4_10_14_0_2_um_filter_33_13]
MDIELIKKIRQEHGTPIVGVIGATNPSEEYHSEMGIKVGYELRNFIGYKNGSIFTGGVEGVGIDTYIGVMRNCMEHSRLISTEGEHLGFDDRFFILVPQSEQGVMPSMNFLSSQIKRTPTQQVAYIPPGEYLGLGSLSSKGQLNIVRAGQHMGERREYVAGVADALIVVNGGLGTLDEAINAAILDVPLIALSNSGGAATTVATIKEGAVSASLKSKLGKHSLNIDQINPDKIYVCEDASELLSILDKLF